MPTAIEFSNISKIYRLGLVSTGTLAHDLKRWWTMSVRGKEDPYLTIGETNDRSTKGESEYVWALRDIDFKVEQGDVEKRLFVPTEFFEGNVEEFWKKLPNLDDDFEKRRQRLEAEGKRWRFVAVMDHGKASVALQEVPQGHPFYNLQGSNNIVMLTTERYREFPMLIQGYGAGASVTAAGVFANIMSIANI